jgi:SAM-dependent methyltransferase
MKTEPMRILENVGQWKRQFLEVEIPNSLPPNTLILDAGCADGKEMRTLKAHGYRTIGFDVDWGALELCRDHGKHVFLARAEEIPLTTGCLGALTSTVVIPLTDEALVLREFSRVLKTGGLAYLSYHGWPYYVRHLLAKSSGWKLRVYAARALLNSWWYAVTGQRLPGFLGDTLYQSPRRLAKYYRRYGLTLVRQWPAQTFMGKLVFFFHIVKKTSAPAVPAQR